MLLRDFHIFLVYELKYFAVISDFPFSWLVDAFKFKNIASICKNVQDNLAEGVVRVT